LVVADEVRVADNLTMAVGDTLRLAGLAGREVGLVGTSAMSAAAYIGLLEVASSTEFVRMDGALEGLRVHKSVAEQKLIRRAASIGNRALDAYMDVVVAGGTEVEATRAGLDVLVPSGAV